MSSPKDVLDPSALISSLLRYLPPSSRSLRSPQDALAVLVHTCFSILAFRLVSISDNDYFSGNFENNVLPRNWNQQGPGNYTFCYKHDQSSLIFIIKLSKLGSRTMINAIAAESDKSASLDISTADFTSESFFPWSAADADTQLIHGFISSNRVSDFTFRLKMQILQKLIPGLRKDGYTEVDEASTNSTSGTSSQSARPTQPQPENPYNPLREQEPFVLPPTRNPLEIGRRDLEPIPNAPHIPRGFAPPPVFPGLGGSSGDEGMFVGPNHPIFSGRTGGAAGIGGRGPWGGDGFLPPMGAPPGARFDPIVPNIGPFPPGGRAPQRRGDPDNDEFMPPGMRDMYM